MLSVSEEGEVARSSDERSVESQSEQGLLRWYEAKTHKQSFVATRSGVVSIKARADITARLADKDLRDDTQKEKLVLLLTSY